MPNPIHEMTDAELDAAIEEAEDAYAEAETRDEPFWIGRIEALQLERAGRDSDADSPHDEHVGLDVPAGYAS